MSGLEKSIHNAFCFFAGFIEIVVDNDVFKIFAEGHFISALI